jgi:putative membrane protein
MPLASLMVLSLADALWDLVLASIFTAFGLLIFGVAYMVIEKLAPFNLRKELTEDDNVAVGAMLGGVFIGIGLIIAAAISGG